MNQEAEMTSFFTAEDLDASVGASDGDDSLSFTYRQLIELAGVGLFQARADGSFMYANDALAHLLGYETVRAFIDAVGAPDANLYVDPEDEERLLTMLESQDTVVDYVTAVRGEGGMQKWVSQTARVIRNANGSIHSIVGTLTDVTSQMNALEALREAERSYRDIFENAAEGIYRSSPDGRQLRANPALVRLNGYQNEQEMLGHVRDIAREWYVDPDRREQFKHLMETQGKVTNFESEVYRHKTREKIWISENAHAVRGSDGQIMYYEGSVQEITARKTAERELREAEFRAVAANRAKSQFLANMSHELRTPLNTIIGFTEVLKNQIFGPIGSSRYMEYIDDVLASATLLLQLIEDILDITKHDSGKMVLELASIEPAELVESVVRMMRERAKRKGIALEHKVEPVLRTVNADDRRLRQILLNLLSNAVKFTPDGGRVSVDVEAGDGGKWIIKVSDTGIGIAEQDYDRAFQPFEQLGYFLVKEQQGTGLGLPLTKKLVEAHGGTIELDSEIGVGTTVIVTLPQNPPGNIVTTL